MLCTPTSPARHFVLILHIMCAKIHSIMKTYISNRKRKFIIQDFCVILFSKTVFNITLQFSLAFNVSVLQKQIAFQGNKVQSVSSLNLLLLSPHKGLCLIVETPSWQCIFVLRYEHVFHHKFMKLNILHSRQQNASILG